jgi:PIN domain nuclease of toxin-antitoxin system
VTATLPLLLDTCAAIWIVEEQPLASEALTAVEHSYRSGELIYVSPITAWEIGLLVSRGKLTSPMSPQRWFERLLKAPGVRLAEMSPESSSLRRSFLERRLEILRIASLPQPPANTVIG